MAFLVEDDEVIDNGVVSYTDGNSREDVLNDEISKRKSHSLWVEKYRPMNLKDLLGNQELKEKLALYIKNNDIPHLLLYGKAGGGKTTVAKLLTNTLKCDELYINASSENSVDTVRERIQNFAMCAGLNGQKIIILDEFDYMSPNAQAALRNIMEKYSAHTRFILTCNYVEKIFEPIISRCQTIEMIPPSKRDVAVHVTNILTAEGVSYEPKDVVVLVNSMYPDIRKIINTCQAQSYDGKLAVNQKALVDSDYKLKIVNILKDTTQNTASAFKNIRQMIADNGVSHFEDAYKILYDTLDDYAKGHLAPVILILADMEYKSAFTVDKEINFMSTIIQILSEIKS